MGATCPEGSPCKEMMQLNPEIQEYFDNYTEIEPGFKHDSHTDSDFSQKYYSWWRGKEKERVIYEHKYVGIWSQWRSQA